MIDGIACVEDAVLLRGLTAAHPLKLLTRWNQHVLFISRYEEAFTLALAGDKVEQVIEDLRTQQMQPLSIHRQLACLTIVGSGLLEIEGLVQKMLAQQLVHVKWAIHKSNWSSTRTI